VSPRLATRSAAFRSVESLSANSTGVKRPNKPLRNFDLLTYTKKQTLTAS